MVPLVGEKKESGRKKEKWKGRGGWSILHLVGEEGEEEKIREKGSIFLGPPALYHPTVVVLSFPFIHSHNTLFSF